MAKHRTHSAEFKRQVAREYIAGENTLKAPFTAILTNVMQNSDDLFFKRRYAQHHSNWMQYVARSSFVDLPCVSFGSDCYRSFESAHYAFIRPLVTSKPYSL